VVIILSKACFPFPATLVHRDVCRVVATMMLRDLGQPCWAACSLRCGLCEKLCRGGCGGGDRALCTLCVMFCWQVALHLGGLGYAGI
jgi:hypothetical protein